MFIGTRVYNICTLRGFSVSNSSVTGIGDQMALRRLVFVLLFDSAGSNCGALRGEQRCNIHSRIQLCPMDEYVFIVKNISHFYGISAHVGHNVSVESRCFQQ